MPFGNFGTMPFTFGGETPVKETATNAILAALSPSQGLGYDTSAPSLVAEVEAHGNVVATIWAVNERVALSEVPSAMMESLPDAETAYGVRPTPQQSDTERRSVIAAKKRGAIGNSSTDLEAAIRAIAGSNFVALHTVDDSERWVFWTMEPGPPGVEWASATCMYQVQLSKDGLASDAEFLRMRSAVENLLMAMLPSSHTFYVGTGTGFQADISRVDEAAV